MSKNHPALRLGQWTVMISMLFMLLAGCAAQSSGPQASDGQGFGQSSGAGESAEETGAGAKSLTLLFNFAASSLDPASDKKFISIRAGVTETLVKLDEKLGLQPWLATKWEQTDAKTWVFTIRDQVTFHDGSKLDAAAVKASLERGIAQSKSLAAALKVESIQADGQTLIVQTKEPNPVFPSELVYPFAAVINVKAQAAVSDAPVGTGPFAVKAFTPDAEVQLKRYDGYWNGAAKLAEATFKFNSDANARLLALQSEEADIVYHLPYESLSVVQSQPSVKVESVSSLRNHFLIYNMQQPHLQDLRVRQAVDALIDRNSIVQNIMQGHATVAVGPFHPQFSFHPQSEGAVYDPAKAKGLLAMAGWTADSGATGKLTKGGQPLTLKLVTYQGRPELPLIAQLIQAEAAKAGIGIEIQMVENPDEYLAEKTDWDLALYSSLTAPRGDAGYFLNSAYMPEGALTYGKANLPELTRLIEQLNITVDLAKRDELARQAVEVIQTQLPQSFIVHPNMGIGVNQRVINWKPGLEEYYLLTNTMDVK
ncbi:nickel ABC transporter substrate-binding protein [Brevibacillus dissolubilis]|uniref:nickel ABC transporter substrate-binding protein n=1 Tax=Brevibacillus dissolubilis TaxID=1844116 RepID=UPI0011161741|nr:nickel ABC transporter substrate-binding protein [Brevibacillus dissolubilis]